MLCKVAMTLSRVVKYQNNFAINESFNNLQRGLIVVGRDTRAPNKGKKSLDCEKGKAVKAFFRWVRLGLLTAFA
jgi:hypothetical protein